jgi:hypothetical protein
MEYWNNGILGKERQVKKEYRNIGIMGKKVNTNIFGFPSFHHSSLPFFRYSDVPSFHSSSIPLFRFFGCGSAAEEVCR